MLSKNVLYHGIEDDPSTALELRAGPLSMWFEPKTVFLRYVRYGERELVRGIYAAVRDRNWGTVAPDVQNLALQQEDDSFLLAFDVVCRDGDIDFVWKGSIAGEADGTVTFRMNGEARSTFLRARIGFCVLHPMECAGQPCRVEKEDGSMEEGAFPVQISPHQPFMDIRALSYPAAPGVTAEIRFEGDVFEMEDQRNWTDASYKTYCTPLRIPFPVEVPEGARVVQSVTVKLHGEPTDAASGPPAEAGAVVLSGDFATGALPALGLGLPANAEPLTEREQDLFRRLQPAHLRVDLDPLQPNWTARLRHATAAAREIGARLEVALHLTDEASAELKTIAREFEPHAGLVRRWLVFHQRHKTTPNQLLALARPLLHRLAPDAAVAGGANAYFTELNRGRPAAAALDAVVYSINPQVHAFDDASLVETLEAQRVTLETARLLYPETPVVISPVTLRPRFNPDATGPEPEPQPGKLPAPVDPRQLSLLGAGWTLGSLRYLVEGGAASVTFYESVGWRGVLERANGSAAADLFPSEPGMVFPLYHVLAWAGEFAGGQAAGVPTNPLELAALLLIKEERRSLLVANLTATPRLLAVACGFPRARSRFLDERSAEQALFQPVEFQNTAGELLEAESGYLRVRLLPYAVARLDLETEEQSG